MRRLLIIFPLVLFALCAPSAGQAQVGAKATIDSASMFVGGKRTIHLRVNYVPGIRLLEPGIHAIDTSEAIELLSSTPWDTTLSNGNAIVLEKDLLLTAWDSGYFELPPIPAGLLLRNKTFLLLATGCRPTATRRAGVTDGQCGPTYNGTTGNLGIIAFELDRSPRANTEMGVQFAHAAAPANDFVKQPVLPGMVLDGSFTPLGDAAVAYASLNKDAATPVTGVAPTDSFGVRVQLPVGPDASIVPVTLAASLPQIQFSTIVDSGTPSFYANGVNYTFVAVGDPNVPQYIDPFDGGPSAPDAGGRPNGYTFHYLGFPNDPTLPPFTP